jgi:hypothetical protein
VRIAAILSFSTNQQSAGEVAADDARQQSASLANSASLASCNILGQSLINRLRSKLNRFGVTDCTIVSGDGVDTLLPFRSALNEPFDDAWENAIANYVHQGVDKLLLLPLSGYCDLDFDAMYRFHLEAGGPITQAYAADGALDVTLVDAPPLQDVDSSYRHTLSTLIPKQHRYLFRGYVNRLARPADFYQLVNDGLRGRCDLRPVGKETREWVWQGPDSEIDESAVVTGPAFIGARSYIAACCTISPSTAIEQNCEVDCGTVVEESWITQNTYLGVALDLRRSIVKGNELFKLDRNIAMKIDDDHLIAPALKSVPFLAGLGDMLRRQERAA